MLETSRHDADLPLLAFHGLRWASTARAKDQSRLSIQWLHALPLFHSNHEKGVAGLVGAGLQRCLNSAPICQAVAFHAAGRYQSRRPTAYSALPSRGIICSSVGSLT